MAINTFTFGGITSSDYGIYVSGEGLFNAPKRDAEVVQIPGRDGDYILDKGSFENIEVTYRVFNQEKDLSDFRTKLANLRSALCSKTGYQRLTDTFHPNEYRMAAFIDGIEINPIKYNTASEFEIKFNCKPQRWLTSGETATAVASGGKVTNPTLFDAKPQLQVYGYGNIDMGGVQISVVGEYIGWVQVFNGDSLAKKRTITIEIDSTYANSSDDIVVNKATMFNATKASNSSYIITTGTPTFSGQYTTVSSKNNGDSWHSIDEISFNNVPFVYGTSNTVTDSISVPKTLRVGGNSTTKTYVVSLSLVYDGDSTFTLTETYTTTPSSPLSTDSSNDSISIGEIMLDSTQSTLGNPMYVDLDIGECYKIENNSAVSVNDSVSLPAELPVLPPGDTTFTYDNTITQFKVLPRWWKV